MKRYFILAAASVVALAACTKSNAVYAPDQEIGFQVAKYITTATKATNSDPSWTAANNTVYSEAASFGSYAIYSNGNAGEEKDDFMSNVEIGKVGSTWAPVKNAYYWPKTGALDFVSYSPFASSWIAPTIDAHKFAKLSTGTITPTHTADADKEYTIDLMYSDVALGCSNNTDQVTDGTNSYSGVPTLFRHALAKLNFGIKLAFNDVKSGTGSNEIYTSWVVSVKSMKAVDVIQDGSLELVGYNANGVWNLPTNNIWTPGSTKAPIALITTADGEAETPVTTDLANIVSNYYVMPQAISDDVKFDMEFTIKTYRYAFSKGAGNFDASDLFLTETVKCNNIQLNEALTTGGVTPTAITSWEMSKNYTYNIVLAPAKGDTEPIKITYDPATADWTPVAAEIKINL